MIKTPIYFSARLIAKVANCHLRTIKRHAVKQGWPGKLRGNTWEFQPPYALRAKCASAASLVDRHGMDGFGIAAERRAELFRANLRFAALCALETAISTMPIETALAAVARDFTFKVSPSALRSWQKRYVASGFVGLLEQKRGRSGRKRKVQA